ncbi:MAG: NAD-dependent epimerase/dehydratase family protein [Calditrichaeota bacterium]|nr:MAG: NAD-dependent epimerase/dehydratase family protein [Calditrichota bacterium]
MKILILGGTVFLGRFLTKSALKRGHKVTHFTRGKSNPNLFPEVENLIGDRVKSDLNSLKGKTWDAVIDTCGYFPRVVKESAELLKDSVEHYTFISSISVYENLDKPNADELTPVAKIKDKETEEITAQSYGPLKALCEEMAEKIMPKKTLNIRPGLIVGPFDPSDRFTYWVHRIAQGGKVLTPDALDKNVQFIDVRDLADWNIKMVEEKVTGIFNATGPDYSLKFGKVLETCKEVTKSNAELVLASEKFLEENEVAPYIELPLWIPGQGGWDRVDCSKAISNGLTFRPISETVKDTFEWNNQLKRQNPLRAGLTPKREKELLEKL